MFNDLIELIGESTKIKEQILNFINLIHTTSNNNKVVEKTNKLIKLMKILNSNDLDILKEMQKAEKEYYSNNYDIFYKSNKKENVLLKSVNEGYIVSYINTKTPSLNRSYFSTSHEKAIMNYLSISKEIK